MFKRWVARHGARSGVDPAVADEDHELHGVVGRDCAVDIAVAVEIARCQALCGMRLSLVKAKREAA
jgi:hypothetical protein